jgi:exopolyphosphatase/guanosine-5'-triphosphate,3'-diphosphate pyrophosphatase
MLAHRSADRLLAESPMKLVLARHARAAKRAQWTGPAWMRPLVDTGVAQARSLADALATSEVERLVSSPALRCRQTLAPLALATNLPIEIDERLGEDADEAKAAELLATLGERATVLCTHGETVSELLARLRGQGLAIEEEPRCEKGSTWWIEGDGARPERAIYRAPIPNNGSNGDAEKPVVRFGVLDLGSTSFHLLVADATADGDVRRVLRERVMLRLGASLAGCDEVPPEICERAVDTARVLGQSARRAHADILLPVATAALRDARNGAAVATRIGEAVGVPTRILSGVEEARLTFGAFRRKLKIGSRLALGLDLGGGSLQLITGDQSEVRFENTLPLGAARMHAELVRSDPMTRDERRAIRARVREHLAEYRDGLRRWQPSPAIATGGSMRAIARLAIAERGRSITEVHGTELDADTLRRLARTLAASSQEERLAMPGMRRQRADLVPTGALILRTVVEELDLPALTVSDWGLREGVILEALERA